jgi:hypothetical protein
MGVRIGVVGLAFVTACGVDVAVDVNESTVDGASSRAGMLFDLDDDVLAGVYSDAIDFMPEVCMVEQGAVGDRATNMDGGDYLGLVEAQVTAPFECWKFDELCVYVGPDNAEVLVESFWADLVAGDSISEALASFDSESQGLAQAYDGDFEITDAEATKFEALLAENGFVDSANIFSCLGVGNDNRSNSIGSTYVRSVVGRTSLGFGTQAWGNGRYYESGLNISTYVCVTQGASWKNGNTNTAKFMNDDCKTQRKVTHSKTWPGSPNNLQVQSCATAGPFNDTVCSCRL